MPFGKIKGQAEREFLDPSQSSPSLEVISVRPGGVDFSGHTEIMSQLKSRQSKWSIKSKELLFPVFKTLSPSMLTPTKDLGKYLTNLALEQTKRPSGEGVLEEGGIVTNVGILKAVKEGN